VTLAARPWDPQLGPLQVATLRRALEREGMVTAWWSDLPGARMTEHAHAFPETRWVVEGFLRVTAGAEAARRRSTSGLETGSTCRRTCRIRSKCSD